jgi:hypothetical protein
MFSNQIVYFLTGITKKIEDARRNPSLAPLDRSERRTWPYLGRHEPPFCGNGVGIPPRGMGI